MSTGRLYLIPAVIADDTQTTVIPPQVLAVLPSLRYFFAENIRTARRYLSSLKIYPSIEPLQFEILDKDTQKDDLERMFIPVFAGESVGILSESGCPGIADPGALAVQYAHEHHIEVIPLVGPSSITLALMASGLNGQKFAFHGYLPIDNKELTRVIKELERESRQRNQTQVFIETPYRNNSVMAALLKVFTENTLLTVCIDITGANQFIKTLTVSQWKQQEIAFPKLPAVFLFLSR